MIGRLVMSMPTAHRLRAAGATPFAPSVDRSLNRGRLWTACRSQVRVGRGHALAPPGQPLRRCRVLREEVRLGDDVTNRQTAADGQQRLGGDRHGDKPMLGR